MSLHKSQGGGAEWEQDGTQVFSGAAPTSYADLDLSAYVGEKCTLVLLKVKTDVGLGADYTFRPNGETEDNAYYSGCACVDNLDANYAGYVILQTDDAGIIEWKSASSATTSIYLMGFIG